MSEREWTPEQQDAILAREGTLLVSAAAGSGKTAVLVQRVIEKLTDKNKPCDADRLLVVTFTNAAAAEMRERISARISELLEKDPDNIRLQRQQILLSKAHISTIHSFCNELVRENFYKINIPPDFRISDSNEMALLREEAIKDTLEYLYEENKTEFINLVECFSASRDDRKLSNAISTLYDFIRSHPFPEKWLDQRLFMYENVKNIAKTEWGKTIFNYAKDAVNYCIDITNNSLELLKQDETINEKYQDAFLSDLFELRELRNNIQKTQWDAVVKTLSEFKFKPLGRLPKGYSEDPLKIKICGNRDEVKLTKTKLYKLFLCSEAECIEDIQKLRPIVGGFFDAVKRFGKRLEELKSEKHIADFSDLEHWAIRLLVKNTESGFEPTKEAVELAYKFDEVMIDEYQDTNEAQDIIFRAVSRNESNLFVVGDVKQSIYGFRQAMPEIFLRRKNSYLKYDREKNLYPAKVILGKNFRSRVGITNSVNFIFGQLMSLEVGEMEYSNEEELVAGASYPDRNIPDTSLHIIDLSSSDTEDMDIEEARHIAEIVAKMIKSGHTVNDGGNQRPITYRDFCILIRSANIHASIYAKELQLCGIPAWSDTAGSFFGTLEVAVMLSMLRVIDNPIQDIPLLSVLMSPIYGFTPDDISDVRLTEKNSSLYFAVKKSAQNGNNRCQEFLQQLNEYRHLAATLPSDRLINSIYEKTGYFAMAQAMKDGELRAANLRLLLEYARNYERSGYRGLSGFIRFIDRLEEQKSDLSPATTISESANVVRVMSIHRSKGLEFPVCILANCARAFNKEKGEVILHPSLGPGIKLRDEDGIRQYTTVPRDSILLELDRSGISEELRVLYVAMTRAKENLIMLTSLKDPQKTLGKLAAQLTESETISPYIVRSANSFSDWLLSCAIRHPSGKELRETSGAQPGIMIKDGADWDIKIVYPETKEEKDDIQESKIGQCLDEKLLNEITNRINFKYKAHGLENIPSKLAASELAVKDSAAEYYATTRPGFMGDNKMTPAERGTALHAFIQFADYKEAKKDPERHIEYLVDKGFLTKEQANAVDLNSIKEFFSSNLVSRILSSKNVMREYRFSVNIGAGELNKLLPNDLKDETVILQGAIDCAFEENGELVVVDYKTDRTKCEEELINRYSKQLSLYKNALEKCTGMKVKECLLYSFSFHKIIEISK